MHARRNASSSSRSSRAAVCWRPSFSPRSTSNTARCRQARLWQTSGATGLRRDRRREDRALIRYRLEQADEALAAGQLNLTSQLTMSAEEIDALLAHARDFLAGVRQY